ncbi:MAG: hypothetical protein PGN29_02755 [Gordonia paraffinivorans]
MSSPVVITECSNITGTASGSSGPLSVTNVDPRPGRSTTRPPGTSAVGCVANRRPTRAAMRSTSVGVIGPMVATPMHAGRVADMTRAAPSDKMG